MGAMSHAEDTGVFVLMKHGGGVACLADLSAAEHDIRCITREHVWGRSYEVAVRRREGEGRRT